MTMTLEKEKAVGQKGIEMPQKENQTPEISRRDFLRGLAAALGVAGATMVGLSLKGRLATQAQAGGELEGLKTTEEILVFIKENYGVETPNRVSEEYTEEIYIRTSGGEQKLYQTRENSLLNFEEAKIVVESASKIPAVGFLVQLIIPFRAEEEEVIPAGGTYLGYQWPAFLRPRDFSEFPRNRFLSEKAAIKLILPEGPKMSDPLPIVEEEYSNAVLTPLMQISMKSAGVEASTKTEIPWTTMGERLKQVFVHETGHGLIDQVTIVASSDMEDYWRRKSITLYNMNTVDIDNPLFEGFAEVNGWRLTPFVEIIRQYEPERAELFAKENPENAQKLFWERDLQVWGSLQNRKVRLTPYASYGPIQEAFCEYWMASILYPGLLEEQERKFFETIQRGLRKSPAAFVQELVSRG